MKELLEVNEYDLEVEDNKLIDLDEMTYEEKMYEELEYNESVNELKELYNY